MKKMKCSHKYPVTMVYLEAIYFVHVHLYYTYMFLCVQSFQKISTSTSNGIVKLSC